MTICSTLYLLFISYDTGEHDKTCILISCWPLREPYIGRTSVSHFRYIGPCLYATPTIIPLKELFIGMSSFHHNVAHGATVDLSYASCRRSIQRRCSYNPHLTSRKWFPSSSLELISFILEKVKLAWLILFHATVLILPFALESHLGALWLSAYISL